MRICTFVLPTESAQESRLGIVEGDRVLEPKGEISVKDYLERGANVRELEQARGQFKVKEVRLLAPVPRPGKIVAAIVNTVGMLGGQGVILDRPRLDMKAPSTVAGPAEEVVAPSSGIRPEVELAAVIGRTTRKSSVGGAANGIFGYTILNDLTAPRDSQDDAYEAFRRDKASGQIQKTTLRGPLFRSKNHDGFCPMGPWIITPDEVKLDRGLRMTTRFDGKLVQEGSTSEYIFSPPQLVSYISSFLTLEPGDVVSCGSVGWTREALGELDPTEFVLPHKEGNLEVEIAGIGILSNPIVSE